MSQDAGKKPPDRNANEPNNIFVDEAAGAADGGECGVDHAEHSSVPR
jgi:hypothetical protein